MMRMMLTKKYGDIKYGGNQQIFVTAILQWIPGMLLMVSVTTGSLLKGDLSNIPPMAITMLCRW